MALLEAEKTLGIGNEVFLPHVHTPSTPQKLPKLHMENTSTSLQVRFKSSIRSNLD